jgi:hypothetical protein
VVSRNVCETLNTPPIEQCPAPFLGLTVHPYGEPCVSAVGFDFLTVEVIQIKKKTQSLNARISASGWYHLLHLEDLGLESGDLLQNVH